MKKVAFNNNYGGFWLHKDIYKKLGYEWLMDVKRDDPKLIELIEKDPDSFGDIEIAEIPDNSTDWLIDDYDGLETVYYVVDGKIEVY